MPTTRELFARPMPYEVIWLRDHKRVSVRTYSYSAAKIVYEQECERGNAPSLYLGGMALAEAEEVAVG